MKLPNLPALETILPVANTLKSFIAGEPQEWSNNAHVAYNTGWIKDVSSGILVSVLQQQASTRDLSSDDKQKVEDALREIKAMHDDFEKLEKSENSTSPDD